MYEQLHGIVLPHHGDVDGDKARQFAEKLNDDPTIVGVAVVPADAMSANGVGTAIQFSVAFKAGDQEKAREVIDGFLAELGIDTWKELPVS